MPEDKPIRNKKYLKKIASENIPVKAEVILPASIPPNKQAWVNQRAEQIMSGELTYQDVGYELKLDDTEIVWVKLYMTGELQGNALEAAILALGVDPDDKEKRRWASAWIKYRILPNHPCMLLGKTLLNGLGFNDSNADNQLLWLIEQNQDLKAKALAIDQYNKLTGRLKKQIEITHKQEFDFSGLDKKKLQTMAEWLRQVKISNTDDNADQKYLPGNSISESEDAQE